MLSYKKNQENTDQIRRKKTNWNVDFYIYKVQREN